MDPPVFLNWLETNRTHQISSLKGSETKTCSIRAETGRQRMEYTEAMSKEEARGRDESRENRNKSTKG